MLAQIAMKAAVLSVGTKSYQLLASSCCPGTNAHSAQELQTFTWLREHADMAYIAYLVFKKGSVLLVAPKLKYYRRIFPNAAHE